MDESNQGRWEEGEKRLNTLLMQTPAVIYAYKIIDGDPVTTYVSESVKDVLGYGPDYFINAPENFVDNLHPEDAEGLFKEEEKLFTDEDTNRITVEYRFQDDQGNYHWLHDEQQVWINEKGQEEVFGAWWDVTERKEAEEKLRQRNEQLDEFASVVSHDLRNPLNVAEGRLKLAREECNSEHLQAVANAHKRMSALVEDLLTLAREGNRVSDIEPVNLARLVEACWRNVDTANATFRTRITGLIQADRRRLEQLLENLIRNAVEHGGDDVTVTVGAIEEGFYVEDDGPGIPEEERDVVFDTGYSTGEEGTGLGLSIVQRSVEAHGWNVRVTEGKDGGARFEFTGVEYTE